MRLEFGRPTTYQQALIRIPDAFEDEIYAEPPMYEHNRGFKKLVIDFANMSPEELSGDIFIMSRMVDMTVSDMRILHRVNSFYRNVDEAFVEHWGYIGSDCDPWALVLPHGKGEYRWWQIGTFHPDVRFGSYRLYYIETNNELFKKGIRFLSNDRFDEESEFVVGFATEAEVDSLKKRLSG